MSKYWNRIEKIHDRQTEKGMKKYGMPIERNVQMSVEERITMLEEELIDALVYLEHLREIEKSRPEVVHCKDCKYWGMGIIAETERIKCCSLATYMIGENGFCTYGEAKEEIQKDYVIAVECKNYDALFDCLKCGKCGRVFNKDGVMTSSGMTHPEDEE